MMMLMDGIAVLMKKVETNLTNCMLVPLLHQEEQLVTLQHRLVREGELWRYKR